MKNPSTIWRLLLPLTLASVTACDAAHQAPADAIDDVALVAKADANWSPCELSQVLLLVNDPQTTEAELKLQGVHTLAARNIMVHRNGIDGVFGTADDEPFDDLAELDSVAYVGPKALEQLVAIVTETCDNLTPAWSDVEVVFSPQTYSESHLSRVVALLGSAQRSLDIAMYSFRDPTVMNAVGDAVARGVSVRLLFDSANEHKADPMGTRSALLEDLGVDVRYVNKIMHHKFVLIDGPRDHMDQASDTVLVTGSANWSYSAGTRYDENTLLVYGNERLIAQFQGEFNLLWENSRDFLWNESLTYFDSVPIPESSIPWDPDTDTVFTSANFHTYNSASYGPTFSLVSGRSAVAERLVGLIESAENSILLASTHLRLRPVAEALLAKSNTSPEVDIRVLLDGQEYTSEWRQAQQEEKLEACLVSAGKSASKAQKCHDVGYRFAREMDMAGIPTRFKWNAFQWHYTYALQMHHKYMLVDGQILATGSYNLSDNAEHNTFENLVMLTGSGYPELMADFRENFESLWSLGRQEGLAPGLLAKATTGQDPIPLVFDPMTVTTHEIAAIKDAIREACPLVDEPAFYAHPEDHEICFPQ